MQTDRDLCPAWCGAKWHRKVEECRKDCKMYQLVVEELEENPSSRRREGIAGFEEMVDHN